jgi:hypothetical protein
VVGAENEAHRIKQENGRFGGFGHGTSLAGTGIRGRLSLIAFCLTI